MTSRTLWIAAAAFTLSSGVAAQGTMKSGMMHGAMKHDMAALPSLARMLLRADSLVARTEQLMRMTTDTAAHAMMMRATTDTAAHAMMMDHAATDSPQAMAGGVHAMATGLRGVLQHMEAMHDAGMKMEGEAGAAMTDVHRRMNTVLGELEATVLQMDQMHAQHSMKQRP